MLVTFRYKARKTLNGPKSVEPSDRCFLIERSPRFAHLRTLQAETCFGWSRTDLPTLSFNINQRRHHSPIGLSRYQCASRSAVDPVRPLNCQVSLLCLSTGVSIIMGRFLTDSCCNNAANPAFPIFPRPMCS